MGTRVEVVPLVLPQAGGVSFGERDVNRLVALDELGHREPRLALQQKHHLQHATPPIIMDVDE